MDNDHDPWLEVLQVLTIRANEVVLSGEGSVWPVSKVQFYQFTSTRTALNRRRFDQQRNADANTSRISKWNLVV